MAGPIEVRGVERTTHHLNQITKRGGNVKDASYKIRTIFRQAEARRFDSRGRGSWADLKDSTKASKRQRRQDPRVMRATNALHKSLTASQARGQIDERGPTEFHFGTELPYAAYHDTGKGVPKRTLIDLTHAERRRIDDALADYIATGDST